MVWQYILVAAIVVLALAYLGRAWWRATKGCSGCHSGPCSGHGHEAAPKNVTMIPEEELKVRRQA